MLDDYRLRLVVPKWLALSGLFLHIKRLASRRHWVLISSLPLHQRPRRASAHLHPAQPQTMYHQVGIPPHLCLLRMRFPGDLARHLRLPPHGPGGISCTDT